MSKLLIIFVALIATTLTVVSMVEAKHVYFRYKRSVEREDDPVPSKESSVVVQGDDGDQVHKSVKDFSNEIATSEKGGKDFFEFDYNPQQDLFKFSGNVPNMLNNPHVRLFEQMMQAMLKQTQEMFQNIPIQSVMNNYPENYNGTNVSEVIIGGRRFRKKERIINKSTGETQLHIVSTVYEPILDDEVTTNAPNKDGVTEGDVVSY